MPGAVLAVPRTPHQREVQLTECPLARPGPGMRGGGCLDGEEASPTLKEQKKSSSDKAFEIMGEDICSFCKVGEHDLGGPHGTWEGCRPEDWSVAGTGPGMSLYQLSLLLARWGAWAPHNRPGHLILAPKFYPETNNPTHPGQVLTSYGGRGSRTELMSFKTCACARV